VQEVDATLSGGSLRLLDTSCVGSAELGSYSLTALESAETAIVSGGGEQRWRPDTVGAIAGAVAGARFGSTDAGSMMDRRIGNWPPQAVLTAIADDRIGMQIRQDTTMD